MPLYSPLTHKVLRRARKNAADCANFSAHHRRHLDDVVLARVKGEIWDPVRLGSEHPRGLDLEELPGMDLQDSLEVSEQGLARGSAAGLELIAGTWGRAATGRASDGRKPLATQGAAGSARGRARREDRARREAAGEARGPRPRTDDRFSRLPHPPAATPLPGSLRPPGPRRCRP